MRSITFYFDFISPYAYLAWTQIHALAERHAHAVTPRPLLFAALLDANGQKGPAEIPTKRNYVFKDSVRTAHRLGVPIAAPSSHPFNPLLALRVASADLPATDRRRLIDALFGGIWARGIDITRDESVVEVASGVGLDGTALVAWAKSAEAKERVKQTTAEALDLGAFGVPTMFVEGELFWGLDSSANLEQRLAGEGPIATTSQPWARVKASATRPGSRTP